MDKPSEGINVKPPGTINGPLPLNKASQMGGMMQEVGNSLPNGPMTKVPPAPSTVSDTVGNS